MPADSRTIEKEPEAAAPLVRTERLHKRYPNGHVGLEALDLEVHRGEILCLLGPNGAGKSTTINLLLGFLKPTSGRAFIMGIDVAEAPVRARRHLAYIPEDVGLYESLSAFENLSFFAGIAARAYGDPGMAERGRLYDALRTVGLREEFHHRNLSSFSKGMRQRVALAICLAKGAEAIVLDDPTIALDPAAISELAAILNRQREEGRAALITTHDLLFAKAIATKIVMLVRGRVVASWDRAEIAEARLDELYLQSLALGEAHEAGADAEEAR